MLILTTAERIRVRKSLRRRFPRRRFPSVISISIGAAMANGRPDPDRGPSVCFYVSSKRMPRRTEQRLPKTVSIRLRRRGRWKTNSLPTDVISFEHTRSSGALLETNRTPVDMDHCTAGILVRWDAATGQKEGVLSVGHSLADPPSPIPQPPPAYLVATIAGTPVGITRAKSAPTAHSDLGIIEFLNKPLVLANGSPFRPGPIVPLDSLDLDTGHMTGFSYRPPSFGTPLAMQIQSYVPELEYDHFDRHYIVRHVVRVFADVEDAFGARRSGSAWTVQLTDAAGVTVQHLFAMQIAADTANACRTGYGQLLSEYPEDPFVSKQFQKLAQMLQSGPITVLGYI